MSKLGIQLESDRNAFAPGEVVRGKAVWDLDDRPTSVNVRLFWYTSGKGTRDVGVVETVDFEHPRAGSESAFEFELPNGPLSFSGSLVSIVWAIELVIEPGGDTERVELVVSPTLQEITCNESA